MKDVSSLAAARTQPRIFPVCLNPCLISARASWPASRAIPRAGDRRWRCAPDLRALVPAHFRLVAGLTARAEAGRPSGHGAAEPLAGRDHPLGLPVRRHHHHAAQLALDRRRTRFLLDNAEAKALVYEAVSPPRRCAVRAAAQACRRIAVGRRGSGEIDVRRAGGGRRAATQPRADCRGLVGDALHLRHHRKAEGRAAPPARRTRRGARPCRAEPLSRCGERTLGVMPLYHTMGVRSLLAMSLIGGAFVCLPRFDVARALELIAAEKITNLYLVPTLYHDLVHHERFKRRRRQLGAQARLCRRVDDRRAAQGIARGVRAGTVRQSLRLVGNLHLHHRPERARKARLRRTRRHQPDGAGGAARRVVAGRDRAARRGRRDHRAARGRRVVRGLLAAARSRRQSAAAGLVLHRRHRLFRRRWRPVRHRPRRRHDHHWRRERLAGRDRKLPVAAPGRVGGCGRRPAGRALGQDRRRLRQAPRARSRRTISTSFAATSGLAKFKRPRRYVFVETIPKSPVGKLLRRKLVAGEYETGTKRTVTPPAQPDGTRRCDELHP